MTGKGTGLASVVDMVTSFVLETPDSGETLVNWRGEVNVAGKLAAFGSQGLLDRMARKNISTGPMTQFCTSDSPSTFQLRKTSPNSS